MKFYPVEPMAKPRARVTRKGVFTAERGKSGASWAAFKAECAVRRVLIPSPAPVLVFDIPIPPSIAKNKIKSKQRLYRPHTQVPDTDNLTKSILDVVLEDDSKVWANLALKRWVPIGKGGIWIGDARNKRDLNQWLKMLEELGA